MLLRWPCLFFCWLIFSCGRFIARGEESKKNDDASGFQGWKCDDMTPNLCDDLQVTKGTFTTRKDLKVHYWRYSLPTTTSNTDSNAIPIVVINGGPGMPHNYDLPLRQLACRHVGREVIFYDQAGSGLSVLPPNTTVADDYPFLLDAAYYGEEELPMLIEALNLHKYHIVGDSWGTMIALQYAAHVDHPNLVSLTLNGPVPKTSDYVEKAWDPTVGITSTLPAYVKKRMRAIEKEGDFESEELQQITFTTFFPKFFTRNGLFADCFSDSFLAINEEIQMGMWGATDFFKLTGTLQNFDLTPYLSEKLSDMPTLLSCGEFDVVRPVTINAMHKDMPLSETVLFKGSGHISVADVTGELLDAVDDFLIRVEGSVNSRYPFHPRLSTDAERHKAPVTPLVVALLAINAFVVGMWVGKRSRRAKHQYKQIF